jgi:biotin carboxyl carrier protein
MAPLPGVITSIKVKAGDSIKSGQVVAVLEAMKMENDLQSEVDGTVREVKVEKGDSVLEGAVIITLE